MNHAAYSINARTIKTGQRINYPEISPPSVRQQLGEILSGKYLAQLAYKWKPTLLPDHEINRTVIIIPGFCGGELSITLLKKYLRLQGYSAYSWGQGFNNGKIYNFFDPLLERINYLRDKHEKPVSLIGWSLGGIMAREIARSHPSLISDIVTLGSPVIGGPKVTALKKLSKALGWDPEQIEQDMITRYAVPIENPITAIYSKADGIVSWKACIDHWSPQVKHQEVSATHIGMGFSPEVYEVVSRSLAYESSKQLKS